MQEMTPSRYLTFTGLAWEGFWATGLIFLGTSSYFVRDWRWLQLVLALPTILTLSWCWLIPESPKWLMNHHKNLAFKQLLKIAERNKDDVIFKECSTIQLNQAKAADETKLDQIELRPVGTIFDIFKSKILLKHIFVMVIVWYSITLSYYGILLYLPKLPGGKNSDFRLIPTGYLIPIVKYFRLPISLGLI